MGKQVSIHRHAHVHTRIRSAEHPYEHTQTSTDTFTGGHKHRSLPSLHYGLCDTDDNRVPPWLSLVLLPDYYRLRLPFHSSRKTLKRTNVNIELAVNLLPIDYQLSSREERERERGRRPNLDSQLTNGSDQVNKWNSWLVVATKSSDTLTDDKSKSRVTFEVSDQELMA